ncbi:MAG: ATP-binding protein [Candidatus Eisenbacteria bacterium]
MKQLRLQLTGILILVALLPALPAAWMTQALLNRVLRPMLDDEIRAGTNAGLDALRDLLALQNAEFLDRIHTGQPVDTLASDALARLAARERATLEAAREEAHPTGRVLVAPLRTEIEGRMLWVARIRGQDGTPVWVTAPVPPEWVARAELLTSNARLIETLRRERAPIVRELLGTFIIVYGGILLLLLLAGLALASRLTRPMAALGEGIASVAAGNLETRVAVRGHGEIGRLIAEFDHMVARLKQQQVELIRLEKISAWRQMARSLAHEIKNPLTPIQLAAQQTRDAYQGTDGEYRTLLAESTAIIEEEVAALRNLVTAFSQFARLPEPQLAPVDPAELMAEVVGLYGAARVRVNLAGEDGASGKAALAGEGGASGNGALPGPHGGRARSGTPPSHAHSQVLCDREQIHRVLINLINNALQAQEQIGCREPIDLRLDVPGADDGIREQAWISIEVADRGPGVAPEHRERVFEPDFTTKAEGMGMGLAIARAAVEAHHGTIAVAERPGGGARFIFTLPPARGEELR